MNEIAALHDRFPSKECGGYSKEARYFSGLNDAAADGEFPLRPFVKELKQAAIAAATS